MLRHPYTLIPGRWGGQCRSSCPLPPRDRRIHGEAARRRKIPTASGVPRVATARRPHDGKMEGVDVISREQAPDLGCSRHRMKEKPRPTGRGFRCILERLPWEGRPQRGRSWLMLR